MKEKRKNESNEHPNGDTANPKPQSDKLSLESSKPSLPSFLLGNIHSNIEQQIAEFRVLHRQKNDSQGKTEL